MNQVLLDISDSCTLTFIALPVQREQVVNEFISLGCSGDVARAKHPFDSARFEMFAANFFIPRAPIHHLATTSDRTRAGLGGACRKLIQTRCGCLAWLRMRGRRCTREK
jgi:hypothetical protein